MRTTDADVCIPASHQPSKYHAIPDVYNQFSKKYALLYHYFLERIVYQIATFFPKLYAMFRDQYCLKALGKKLPNDPTKSVTIANYECTRRSEGAMV